MNSEKKISRQASPLLSICIPTWNRAPLLAVLLENIRREIAGLEDLVEIVVADNASNDDTALVTQSWGMPITYGKQQTTVGMASNIFFAACDLAHGEFVWMIGDDDLIVPGGIRRVLESLQRVPDIDYHYINFGWIDVKLRERVLRDFNGQPPEAALRSRQFDLLEWRRLEKGEDLAYVPGYNPSSVFAGIFCYATRRSFYLEARSVLRPSDSFLDGSSNLLDDSFPHAMITVPKIIGKPIAYIGEPCMMQGINGWEWGRYSYKTMLLGQYELMNWLEAKGFDAAALAHLRVSLTQTTGRLLARMLLAPDTHFGLEVLTERVLPAYVGNPEFWRTLTLETQMQMEIEGDAKSLVKLAQYVDAPGKRVGLLGIKGRGEKVLSDFPGIAGRLSWLGDSDIMLEGHVPNGCPISVSNIKTLNEAKLDILILGMKPESVSVVIDHCRKSLLPGAFVVSVGGILEIAALGSEQSSQPNERCLTLAATVNV